MNPSKAIEILAKDVTYSYPTCFNDLCDAIQLGKEALIRHRDKASLTFAGMMEPLPSETDE